MRNNRLGIAAFAVCAGLFALSGRASIIDGSSQSLSVKTATPGGDDVADARCALTNNKGTWYLTSPASVAVHRSYDDMNVTCSKAGYIANARSVSSATKGMTFGNILFGSLIGAAVDMGTGSAYDYPSPIIVQLQPVAIPGPRDVPTS